MAGKSQHAYEELRRQILNLELEPGSPLVEGDISDRLGVGRTPLREAIQRLATEKLVVARPRQTPFVAPILVHELSSIVEIRLIVEVPASRLAALRGHQGERRALADVCDRFRELALQNDLVGIMESDAEIHDTIAVMARNAYLCDFSRRMSVFSQRIWRVSSANARFSAEFPDCHDDLVSAIAAGDPERASEAARRHVGLFKRRLSHLIGTTTVDEVAI